jgi:hypothetical protein
MTKECLGPDCAILGLQGVSVPFFVPVVLSRGASDDCALLCAKCATYSGPDGSLLVLQDVSIADYLVMAIFIVALTN